MLLITPYIYQQFIGIKQFTLYKKSRTETAANMADLAIKA